MDERPEAALMRVSDAERDAVAEVLRDAAAHGRLDFDELDHRLGLAYAAKTYGDLAPITADLPAPPPTPVPAPLAGHVPSRGRGIAVMSGVDQRGMWRVPEHWTGVAFWGGLHLDLRDAVFASPEVTLSIYAVMGGAEVIVAPDTEVIIEGFGLMGGFSGPSGLVEAGPTSRTVRVRGFAFWGGVSVNRKHPRGISSRG